MSSPVNNYDRVAYSAAEVVISAYSTSFSAATRLLAATVRRHVRAIYAMVRIADEIVDAGLEITTQQASQALDSYETEVLAACQRGFSTDLVIHAFALTARQVGIEADLIVAFFASMRTDLSVTNHDRASLERYIYGSAEVVGLMCLRAFLAEVADRAEQWNELAPGAQRLGAAFQKVNFLRDLAADNNQLGRVYVGEVTTLTEEFKHKLVAEIDADLAAADTAIAALPSSSRAAVRAAYLLFQQLNKTISATPVSQLRQSRVRVGNHIKALLIAQALRREGLPR